MKQILYPVNLSENSVQSLDFAATAASKIHGRLLLFDIAFKNSEKSDSYIEQPEKSDEERKRILSNLIEGVWVRYGVDCHYTGPSPNDDGQLNILGELAVASEAIVVGLKQAIPLLNIVFGRPQQLSIECPVIIVPELQQTFEPEQLIYLHKSATNPWTEIVLPAWWSQLLGINFNIWTEPTELTINKPKINQGLEELFLGEQQENIVQSIHVHSYPEPDKPQPGTIFALALNHRLSDEESFFHGFIQKSVNPILVFDVS